MVASGNGNNQYSERKICEKFTVMGHMKAMWRAFSQKKKKPTKNEINDSKDLKDIPNTSNSENQKSNYNNDKKGFISHSCQYPENSF